MGVRSDPPGVCPVPYTDFDVRVHALHTSTWACAVADEGEGRLELMPRRAVHHTSAPPLSLFDPTVVKKIIFFFFRLFPRDPSTSH